jgi:phosphatidylglycerol---prolipoprotein diacylglyceryl transferase
VLQTLVTIPRELAGVTLTVWLFGIWAVVSMISLARLAALHGLSRAIAESWTTILITGVAIWILPNLMEPSGLPIRGYGVMLVLAVAAGVGLSCWRAERIGFDPEIILSLAMWLFVSGIVGARLFYVIEYWHTFQSESVGETLKAILSVTKGGLVVYGCMLAGGAALAVFVYKYRLPGLVISDLIAPGVVLGMAIGRLGCFLNGCCYGGVCDLPWAVRFPAGSPPFMEQLVEEKLFLHSLRFKPLWNGPAIIDAVEPNSDAAKQDLRPGDQVVAINNKEVKTADEAHSRLLEIYGEGAPIAVRIARDSATRAWTLHGPPKRSEAIHPTQLYSAIDAFLLCLFLLAYDPYRQREGELTALLLTLHPISRFLLEIIRIDESAVFGTSMSISQNISIGVFIGAIVCWYVVLSRPKGLWQGMQVPVTGAGGR